MFGFADRAAARLSDPRCTDDRGHDRRWVLGAEARDQPHRHHPAHPETERRHRPGRQLREGRRQEDGAYEGRRFNDTDIYKIIEAASYSLALVPDPRLSTRLDELIELIAAAQEKDGYLFPARTIDPQHPAPGVGPERWIYENGSHELYNAGHLYEAAVAHFQATGKRSLLDVAIRNADLVCRTFGPNGRRAVPDTRRSSSRS